MLYYHDLVLFVVGQTFLHSQSVMWCWAAGLTDSDISKENNTFETVGSINPAAQQITQKTKILNINTVEALNLIYLHSAIGIKFFRYISLYNIAGMKSAYLHFQ
jgi:hypothetical protein